MLGPDDGDLHWYGRFYGDGALGQALTLDAMRRVGTVLPLVYAGTARQIIVARLEVDIERVPVLFSYHIVCRPIVSTGASVAGSLTGSLSGSALAAAMAQ
jgi:hypothetical protein